jgi:hypothetical protein
VEDVDEMNTVQWVIFDLGGIVIPETLDSIIAQVAVDAGVSNSALIRPSAASAPSGVACRTATRSPSWMTRAPLAEAAADTSRFFSLAPCTGGRSILA